MTVYSVNSTLILIYFVSVEQWLPLFLDEEITHAMFRVYCFSFTTFLDVEDGHTLHLVVRHPGQSATSGNAATEGL